MLAMNHSTTVPALLSEDKALMSKRCERIPNLVLKIGALCKDLCASIKNEAEGNLRWLETIKQQAIDIQNSIKEELKVENDTFLTATGNEGLISNKEVTDLTSSKVQNKGFQESDCRTSPQPLEDERLSTTALRPAISNSPAAGAIFDNKRTAIEVEKSCKKEQSKICRSTRVPKPGVGPLNNVQKVYNANAVSSREVVDKVKKTTLYRNNLTSLKRLKATQIAQKKAREVDLEAPRTARNKHERVQSKLYKGRERQPHQTSKNSTLPGSEFAVRVKENIQPSFLKLPMEKGEGALGEPSSTSNSEGRLGCTAREEPPVSVETPLSSVPTPPPPESFHPPSKRGESPLISCIHEPRGDIGRASLLREIDGAKKRARISENNASYDEIEVLLDKAKQSQLEIKEKLTALTSSANEEILILRQSS
ncbi:uncharacterized protein LOC135120425 isoform X2 [Zophobas morio]|uniref:uncharacterized protein LOC135120425 isoform X2 n=1 Tax=Zophobas morio TaxID=2755281 RepID=UPI003082BBC2